MTHIYMMRNSSCTWVYQPQRSRGFLPNLDYVQLFIDQHHIPTQLTCAYLKGHLTGRALNWFDVLSDKVVEKKVTDYAQLKQALTEQFPVVRNRSELETRFYASYQNHNQRPSDFVYELLKLHKQLKLEMVEEKLLDHIISRLEPQLLDYVEVQHPQTTSSLLQIIDKYEERFLYRMTRGSSQEFRNATHSANNQFTNRNRQENWWDTRVNNRYYDTSRQQRESKRFGGQGVSDNRRFDSRSDQSDHRINNHGGRQGGSRNDAFRGQNDQNRVVKAQGAPCCHLGRVELQIRIREFQKTWEFHILNNMQYQGILGIDFMKDSRLTLDFDKKSLVIPDDQIKPVQCTYVNVERPLALRVSNESV
ncbi:uncharacterized protein TNCV_727031 [Trichonephila clavipes]|nr:uncharacterized protein TNCV_727031 [Trichonephila clavipes]